MDPSANAQLEACLRVFNGEVDDLDEVFSPEVVVHASIGGLPPMTRKGLEGIEFLVSFFHTPFPDVVFEPSAFLGEGLIRTCKWTAKGTHSGPLFSNIEPLSLPVALPGAFMCRSDEERIGRLWMKCDFEVVFSQLGMAPSAPPAVKAG